MTLLLVPEHHPMRSAVEACAKSVYERVFDARLTGFPKLMAAIVEPDGTIKAVVGLRRHVDGFFCARYLSASPAVVLSGPSARPVPDDAIIEITTLAGRGPAALLRMFESLCFWAPAQGYEWGIFTATSRIRRLLQDRGLPYRQLAAAAAYLVPDREGWGTYYASDPVVCAVAGREMPDARRRCPVAALQDAAI